MSESGVLPASGSGRMVQLDGLRAFAAVAVILSHNLGEGSSWLLQLGSTGVRLFFVLSGFLITRILLKARTAIDDRTESRARALLNFYARRNLRIFPLYYATIAVALLMGLAGVATNLPWFLTYTTNLKIVADGAWTPSLSHFWTLAVEEQFYLVWPSLILFCPRRWFFPIFVILVTLSPVARVISLAAGRSLDFYRTIPVFQFDALGLGALLALAWDTLKPESMATLRKSLGRVALGSLVLCVASIRLGRVGPGGLIFAQLGSVALTFTLLWLVDRAAVGFRGPVSVVLGWRPVVYLGEISYGLYIYHMFLIDAARTFAGHVPELEWLVRREGLARFAADLLATVIVASLSWRFFEKPLNDFKRYFTNAPPEREAVAPVAIAAPREGGVYSPVQA